MRSARPPLASPSERNRPSRRSGSRGEGRRRSPVTINLSVSAYISVKIPRRRGELPQKGAVVRQPPGYKMHHFAFAFKYSFDAHQACAEQLTPLALGEIVPDNDVEAAGLVLERHEHRSRGGARALATGDDTRRPDPAVAWQQADFLCGAKAHAREVRAQQRKWMAPQGETGARVVGHEILSLGWRRKNRRSFRHWRIAQDVRAGFDSCDLPIGLAAIAGERLERSCSGKALQVVPAELGAAGKILDTVEQPVPPRGDNALGARLRQALHQEKSEPNRRVSRGRPQELQRAIPFARTHVHRPHLDAMPA